MKKTTYILTAASFLVAASASATTTLIGGSTNNGDFESPDVASPTNFTTNTITNWSNWSEIDTADNDTGVYDSPGNTQTAYIQPGGAIVNMTSHTIALGDTFDYGFDDVIGGRGDATMQLVWNNGGTLQAITGTDLVGNLNTNNTTYSDSYTVQAGDAWIGSTVGVGLLTSASYPEVDNITLSVTAVPEPSSAALLGLGGLALILRRRK